MYSKIMIELMDLTIIFQIIAALSAMASAICAFLIYKGNQLSRKTMEEWSKTLVQPRIFLRPSSIAQRQRLAIGLGGITNEQIFIPGIFIENIGLGPAVKGVIYVIDHENNKIPLRSLHSNYSFLRIPAGSVYHYPSNDSPEVEQYIRNQNKIRIQVDYFDIKDNLYHIPQIEEEIDLILD
jgi:hypothetical protein